MIVIINVIPFWNYEKVLVSVAVKNVFFQGFDVILNKNKYTDM